MTDDELTLAAEALFLELDRSEAASERAIRYKQWILTVLCWDGILPLAVVAIPSLLNRLFAPQAMAQITVNAVVPSAAFFVRAVIGSRDVDHGNFYRWQVYIFFMAIMYLFFLEAAIIAIHCIPLPMSLANWLGLAGLYLIYLVAIATALFPFRPSEVISESVREGDAPFCPT